MGSDNVVVAYGNGDGVVEEVGVVVFVDGECNTMLMENIVVAKYMGQ